MKDINLTMFKPYDIRTKIEKLTDENLDRLARAVAIYYKSVLKVKEVVLCRDARLYAPKVIEALITSFRLSSIDVLVNPLPISTCQFYYSCMRNPSSGGIMVTASHNPGEYIGLKLMAQNLFPLAYGCGEEGGIEKIKEIYIDNKEIEKTGKKGSFKTINYLDDFISYSMKLAGVEKNSLSGMKVLVEFLNGSAGSEITRAFELAGVEVEPRNIIPNGFFPHGDPNPIIESSIKDAREAMKNGDYCLGFCFDGDGDRMDLMYKDGSQIVPGLNMAVISKSIMDIYNGEKKEFYADVKAIPISLCQMAKRGVKIHIIRNGHSFIKAKLRENCNNGYFGSEEESAHYYLNFPYDIYSKEKGYAAVENTLFFALLTLKAYKDDPSQYDEVHRIQNSIFRAREWPLNCDKAPEKMPEIMDRVEKKMREEGAFVIKNMDDGSDLDATLMRFNLPNTYDENTDLDNKIWAQVAQRISRSEDAMCRWEVVSNDENECNRLNNEIKKITDEYVEAGFAYY